MSGEISQLAKTLNEFMQQNAGATARLEAQQEHLTSAVKRISIASTRAIESNIRLESKISSLEDTLNNSNTRFNAVVERINTIEIVQANNAGKSELMEKNWYKIFTLFTVICGAVFTIVKIYFSNGGTG